MSSEDALDRVGDLVEEIVDALDLDAEVEVEQIGSDINVIVDGDDVGLFIGRHGQTIDAVQHLAYKVAGRGGEKGLRVTIDAAGYRDKRKNVLERQAADAAERAVSTGKPVALDAMSAVERKVVHEFLKDRDDVETWSEGVEPDRHLVVGPLNA